MSEGKGQVLIWVALVLSILIGVTAIVMTSSNNSGEPEVSGSRDDLMFDMAWEDLGDDERTAMCSLRDSLPDDQYRELIRELGKNPISTDSWFEGMDRNC